MIIIKIGKKLKELLELKVKVEKELVILLVLGMEVLKIIKEKM